MSKKICIVTTMSSSINNWVKPFLGQYHDKGFDITVVCNMDDAFINDIKKQFPFVTPVPVRMPRGIGFLSSIQAVLSLFLLFRKNRYDLVQYSTPNASFYASLASFFAGIPVRVYCQWGMVFVTMSGIKRKVFRQIEKTTCRFSTVIQPDSRGNLDFCRHENIYPAKKSYNIWNGSAKGVDLTLFNMSQKAQYAKEIKEKHAINTEDFVIGFVGRLGKEKGCNELFYAFKKLSEKYNNLKLLFVGPLEKEETIAPDLIEWFWSNDAIIKTGRVCGVEKYFAAMDIFVLPSYREGFGMSVVEAEAMGVPVIVTDIPGPTNGMIKDETGLVVPVKDVEALCTAIEKLMKDEEMRTHMGANGREYAAQNFDSKVLIRKTVEDRISLIKEHRGL